jgi:phage protein D
MALRLASLLGSIGGAAPADDTTDLRVTVGKTPLRGEAAACLLDVSVTKTVEQAAQLTLRVAAWDSDSEELKWIDDAMFTPGMPVEVEMGYLGRRVPVFFGDIVSLAFDASTSARAVLTITAYDVLHRLGRGERNDKYTDKTYAGIVRDVALRVYKLPAVAIADPIADQRHDSVVQENQSDLAFLLELAKKIDHELYARGPALVFHRSRRNGPPMLTLDAARDLTQFSAHLSAANQLGGVDVRLLSSETKLPITVSVPNPSAADSAFGGGKTRTVLIEDPLTTVAQARARAVAELARMRANYIEATGSALGRPDLDAGMMIQIANLGKRFGGAYYVTSVTHSMSESGGLRTSFTLKGGPR